MLFLSPEQKEVYTKTLTENPLFWAQSSIDRINELIREGSHEPSKNGEVDPDEIVESSVLFLQIHVAVFETLSIPVPPSILEAIKDGALFLSHRS